MAQELTPYEDVASSMRTGDVILIAGTFPFSAFFQKFQGAKWDHVAMVVKPEDVGISFDGVLLWESNDVPLQDLRTGGYHSGPQLVSLRDRLVCCQAMSPKIDLAWRSLDAPRDEERLEAIKNVFPVNGRAKFPDTVRLFAYLLIGKYLHVASGRGAIGCSENVSITYQAAKWLDPTYVPNGFDPRDYSSEGSLPLINGATLAPEVALREPRPVG